MRRFIFLFLLLSACNVNEPQLDGFYTLTSAKYGDSTLSKENIAKHTTIKICKNGYWITATYSGNPKISVESASGGTYTVKNGNYIETVNFYSQNDSVAGKAYDFSYSLHADKLVLEGNMSNDICANCLISEEYHKSKSDNGLSDTSLEGVWKLQSSEWFGKKVEDPDYTMIKIYSHPYFAWAQYHSKGKDFIGTAGGTYSFDGKKLIEHVEYFSFYDNIPYDFDVSVTKLPSGAIQQLSVNGGGKEIYGKIQ